MRISHHDQQVLIRFRDGVNDEIIDAIRVMFPNLAPRDNISIRQLVRPILDRVLREAREWGYSKRDAEQELGPAPEEGDYR